MAKPKHQFLELLEQQPTEPEDVPATVSSHVGATLRAAREDYGDSLRQVADSLKIRYVYLQAIEDGRFDDLPGSTYAVGFVRAYADFLGLDGDEIVRRFREETTDMHSRQELVFPEPIAEGRTPSWATLIASVLILATVFGGWYYLTNKDRLSVELVPKLPDNLADLLRSEETGSGPPGSSVPPESTAAAAAPVSPAAPVAPEPAVPAMPEPAEPEIRAPVDEETTIAAAPVATDRAEVPPSLPAVTAPPTAEVAEETADLEEQGSAMAAPEVESFGLAGAPETDTAATPQPSADTDDVAASAARPEAATSDPRTEVVADPAARLTTGVYSEATDARDEAPARTVARNSDVAALVEQLAATPPDAPVAETVEPHATAEEVAESRPPPAPPAPSAPPAPPAPPVPGAAAAATQATESQVAVATEPIRVDDSTEIVLRARLDSYVQVHDAADNVLHKGVLRAGESYRVPQGSGLSLMTGNAGAIEIFVGGASTPAIGPVGAVRRNVALDPVRLLRGQAVID